MVKVGDYVELNNGKYMRYVGNDAWSRPIMEYKDSKCTKHYYVLVDNKLYTRTRDGEPSGKLIEDWQLKNLKYDFNEGIFYKVEK